MVVVYDFEDLRYMEHEGVYPVREDTLFLIDVLRGYLDGRPGMMMDMGCGTGLASLIASSKGWKVVSADREPLALSLLRRNLRLNDLSSELYLSDLFEGVPRRLVSKFDLMIFNPPYLEEGGTLLDRRGDLALVRERDGTDIVKRFLQGCRKFLAGNGTVLIFGYRQWLREDLFENTGLFLRDHLSKEKDIDGEVFTTFVLTARP